ncbi:MAG: hypothetical protein WA862_07890, partial [Solirubrobacterales bacterium]
TAAACADGPAQALAGSTRAAVGTLLIAGWIGLTVLGSLLHLLAVVVRVRGGFAAKMPTPRPRLDIPLAALAVAGIAGLALSQRAGLAAWHDPATVLILAAYATLAARIATLAARVLSGARPRI